MSRNFLKGELHASDGMLPDGELGERKMLARPAEIFIFYCATVAYSIALFQRAMPASFAPHLIAELGITWEEYGYFSSIYLIAYLGSQIPAGMLVDKYGPSRIFLISLLLSFIGTIGQALVNTYSLVLFARAICALGDAFVFSVLIKMAATLFSKMQFAWVMSIVQLAGSMGVLFSTVPLRYALTMYSWKAILIDISIAVFVLLVLTLLSPSSYLSDNGLNEYKLAKEPLQNGGNGWKVLKHCIPTVFSYAAFYFIYIFLFSAWGDRYISNGIYLTSEGAATSLLCGTIGLSIGGLASGFILRTHKDPGWMSYRAALLLAGSSILLSLGSHGKIMVTAYVFLIGLSLGALSNSITATVRERFGLSNLSFVSAVHAVFGSGVNALLMPLLGIADDAPPSKFLFIFSASLIIPSMLLVLISFGLKKHAQEIEKSA